MRGATDGVADPGLGRFGDGPADRLGRRLHGGPNGLSVFRGGAVIHDAHLKLSGTSDGSVPIFTVGTSATAKRFVVITALAASPGEAPVTARAVVELRKPASIQLVIVRSWRTQ